MVEIKYPVFLKQEDCGYFVEFVDLPDTFTEGATVQEALDNAAEVLSAMLNWRIEEKLDIPSPSGNVKGAEYLAPDMKTQVALLSHQARVGK